MITAWRIVKKKFAATAFSGDGARIYGGRWNSEGVPVVYGADSIALAVLEIVLHAGDSALIPSYVLFELTFDDPLVIDLPRRKLPSQWRSSPPPAACQAIGDAWVRKGESAVLRVPSVVHPRLSNFLLNPAHADFARITRGKPEPISLDARLSR